MADEKITELGALATAVDDDILPIVDDPAGTPVTKKITRAALLDHTLLNADTHTDTAADTVSRGSLIYGNSTPAWDELVIGAANTVLWSDGTDVSWSAAPRIANIADTGGTNRLTLATSAPHVKSTGAHEVTEGLRLADAGQAGIASKIVLANDGDKLTAYHSQGGLSVSAILGTSQGFTLGRNHFGALLTNTSSTTPYLDDIGFLKTVTTTGTVAQVSDTGGLYTTLTSGTSSGDDAGIEQTNLLFSRSIGAWFLCKFAIPSTANIRLFIGMTDQTLATMVAADNPAGNYLGLQYSSARGDTNWQVIRKNNITQTVTDSGVAVDTNVHFFRARISGTSFVGQMFSSAFVLDWSKLNSGLNTPTNSTLMRWVWGIETQTTAAKVLRHYYSYLMGDLS